ncbi:RNA polymerase factor sigma-54 [Candidatus Marinimicrobia bacterium MT.SAG.3]|nr:RNA polymerase factor sigma-54 [Candidatus Marinimicrobia bacterium MT.SAG.3]TFB11896.1 RNA polymerase factor sigma-54 [Candidatus Marinimicrobia bacterium MT.SAG.4]
MLELRQTQGLRLVQSPQQILLSSLLQLQVQALELRIHNELEMNPLLEMDELTDVELEEVEETDDGEEFELEDFFDNDDNYEHKAQRDNSLEERDMPQVARTTFKEFLLDQLHQLDLSKDERRIGEEIIWNIESNGYLTATLESIAELTETDVSVCRKVQAKILKLNPPGIGALTLRECLLAQMEENEKNGLTYLILKDYFDHFANKRFEKIISELDIRMEDIVKVNEEIAKLNPKPGLSFADQKLNYVIPDFTVENNNGNLTVVLNDFSLPELKISEQYKTMAEDKKNVDKETRNYLKKKLESARWLIASIYQRKLTMLKVMEAIVGRQMKWFELGPGHLMPMIQKDIAVDIKMDHSTVSRATDGKYVQTDNGVFPLKYFFSEGLERSDGEVVSTSNIKIRLKELIENEPNSKPLSDDKLTKMLMSEGFNVARRTVAKYREYMKIPVARLRRKIGD